MYLFKIDRAEVTRRLANWGETRVEELQESVSEGVRGLSRVCKTLDVGSWDQGFDTDG